MKFTRDEILDRTLAYAEKEGWKHTTVREISRQIKYSTIKIYHEFGGKEGLMKELQVKGFRLLRDCYVASMHSAKSPEHKMVDLCKAHYSFAIRNKRYYELMFQTNSSLCNNVAAEVLQHSSEPVKELIVQIAGKSNTALFLNWWSLIHGFTVIMQNNFSMPEKGAMELLETIVLNFIKGIKN